MMCICDRDIGEKILAHQLQYGQELETGNHVEVTGGFQNAICSECRGGIADNFPTAAIHGHTSKIKRYYWRELEFLSYKMMFQRFGNNNSFSVHLVSEDSQKSILAEALRLIKIQHSDSPKYVFFDESQAAILSKYNIEKVELRAEHIHIDGEKRVTLVHKQGNCSAEEFASRHFKTQGYQSLLTESIPFHVLFGVFTWQLIQDFSDERVDMVGFGSRDDYHEEEISRQIWTPMPQDFGKKGYGRRRKSIIDDYFSGIVSHTDELLWLFDYFLPYSNDFRQYLWAYRDEDIETARKVIEILPPDIVIKIVRFLIDDYWGRYCGWPDLLVYNDEGFFFAEVKSSRDKLSGDQKTWIENNYNALQLPFKLVKIHKPNKQ